MRTSAQTSGSAPRARGTTRQNLPPAVQSLHLRELNAEPLLLHLLIISGYTGEKWRKPRTPNVVYASILCDIYKRDKNKPHRAASKLDERDFFTLQECLGLAAWRGNGRTLSDADYAAIRDLHGSAQLYKFKDFQAAELPNVALQSFTRRDLGGSEGYEFIHKSFGEYLAARGLLEAGLSVRHHDRGAAASTAGKHSPGLGRTYRPRRAYRGSPALPWRTRRGATVSNQKFRGRSGKGARTPSALLTGWHKRNVTRHRVDPDAEWPDFKTTQRCSEAALLAVLDALNSVVRAGRLTKDHDAGPVVIATDFGGKSRAALHFLNRVRPTPEHPVRRALGCLALDEARLDWAFLGRGEPGRGAPVWGEPAQGVPGRGGPVPGAPGRGEPVAGEPDRGAPRRGVPGRGGAGLGEPAQGASGRGAGRGEPSRGAPGRGEPGPGEPGRGVPGLHRPERLPMCR